MKWWNTLVYLVVATDRCWHHTGIYLQFTYYTFWFRHLRLLPEALVCESVRNLQVLTHTYTNASSVLTYTSLRYNAFAHKCIHFHYKFLYTYGIFTNLHTCIYTCVVFDTLVVWLKRFFYNINLNICELFFEFTPEIAFLI